MKSRILGIRRTISSLLVSRRQYAAKIPERCDAHMNELPVPCGPWDPWYKEKQAYYNKILLFGALWFIGSWVLAFYTESIYLNWGPPAQPAPPSDMIEECDDSDT